MFNIIETLWNYFTCKLLPNNLSSEVAPPQHKLLAAIFGGKLFGRGSVQLASAAPCDYDRKTEAVWEQCGLALIQNTQYNVPFDCRETVKHISF